jgi:sterol desaturase/sphingolipid hydroxylase (fatty acid hydroxylase superfamily)
MISTFVDYLASAFWVGVSASFLFWLKGISSLGVVGTIYWLFIIREKEKRSFTSLVSYVAPKEYYSHPTMRPAYWNGILSLAIFGPLIGLFGGAKLSETIASFLVSTFGRQEPPFHSAWQMVAIDLALLGLVPSFFNYWLHYACHKVPLLWSFHRVHHSAEAPGIAALLHTHPLEGLAFGPLLALPTALVGGPVLFVLGVKDFHPAAIAILAFFLAWEPLHGVFEHSHVRISFGWFNRIYGGAVLHQFHHSAELRHRDKNLGTHFGIMWDWIFGTIYIPVDGEQYRWGLNDEEFGDNNPHLTVCDFYLEPFRHAVAVLKNKRIKEGVPERTVAESASPSQRTLSRDYKETAELNL